MKTIFVLTVILGSVITSGCHARKANQVVIVKNGHHNKMILIDNDHKRKNYRIVYAKPKKQTVCKKHRKHWHCV